MQYRRADDESGHQEHRDQGQQPPPTPVPRERLGVVGRTGRRRARHRGLVQTGDLEAGQLRRELGRIGREGVARPIPGDRPAVELLGDDVAVIGLIGFRGTQFAGGPTELLPGCVDGPAHDERTEVRGVEDHRLVGGGEGDDSTGRAESAVGLAAGREAQVTRGAAGGFVPVADHPRERIGSGLRAVVDLAAGEVLDESVGVVDGAKVTLPGSQRTHRAPGRARGRGHRRGRIARHVQTGELTGQIRRIGGEDVGLAVPRHLTAGELLRQDVVAGVRLVFGGHSQDACRPAQLVPGRIDRATHHMCTGRRRPEDHGLVRGAEGGVAAVCRASRSLVDGRETQVTIGGTAHGLVLLEDGALHVVGAGVGGEEHLAAGEVLGEARTDGVDLAFAGPQRSAVTACGLPGRRDRGVGIGFRRCRRRHRHRERHHHADEKADHDPPNHHAQPHCRPSHAPSHFSAKFPQMSLARQLCFSARR